MRLTLLPRRRQSDETLMADVATGSEQAFAELAAGLHISPGGASCLVDQLFRAGFLRRTVSPCDRRRIRLTVTSEGEGFLRKAEALFPLSRKDGKRPG